jgi:hypothetical protein
MVVETQMRRFVFVLGLLCAACGGSSPAAPSPPASPSPAPAPAGLAGTWIGSITHPSGGSGTLRLTLSLNPLNSYTGTWQTQFANPDYTRTGQAQSTTVGVGTATIGISDNGFATSPVMSAPGCLFDRTVILMLALESNDLSGDALFGVCTAGATLGSVALRRQ